MLFGKVKASIGDLVRYDFGSTALMRVTDIIGGRYYGRAFHSTGTCTSRSEVMEPSEEDRAVWRDCHDADDNWIRGAWGAASAGEADRPKRGETRGSVHEHATGEAGDAQPPAPVHKKEDK